ncbi:MAG: hypothetical protein ETSY1_31250 [Candidatus Entotheonella factor]|uniref:Globin domain-containing protein n=1 Tax=Entotheonella factor TaxID=1429438 RepID=W4LBL3_ENTF1|nr:globin family protein [Candidatus Entotheonella palauensis]ETW95284.1 MAG: hypothetical protein ETSY1_31250 [Candidatus Entotheonella factor]
MNFMSKLYGFLTLGRTALLPMPSAESKVDGSISARQAWLVQSSWKHVRPIADQAATLFYDKLFELDPSIKPLFAHTEMKEQQKKLMQTMTVVVNGLNRLDKMVPAVQALGKRHIDYGVQADHYSTVGAALLWTLQQGLGEAFTPEVEEAWSVTYTVLAGTMQGAAAEVTV